MAIELKRTERQVNTLLDQCRDEVDARDTPAALPCVRRRGKGWRMIQIDKGIEMPAKRKRRPKYPWLEMEIGDSFLWPSAKHQYAQISASQAGKESKRTFSCRPTPEGIRIWRTA